MVMKATHVSALSAVGAVGGVLYEVKYGDYLASKSPIPKFIGVDWTNLALALGLGYLSLKVDHDGVSDTLLGTAIGIGLASIIP